MAALLNGCWAPGHKPSAGKEMAEADGNRTRQTEILDLTGFEDRGAHQEPRRLRSQRYPGQQVNVTTAPAVAQAEN